jgi:drug/metabolite transporter (DMT)-like permease
MGLLYIVVFPSVCSFMFWNISVRAIGASQAGIFINLIPVFTAFISVLLGEKITWAQVWGGLLVLTGVCFATGIPAGKWGRFSQQTALKTGSKT